MTAARERTEATTSAASTPNPAAPSGLVETLWRVVASQRTTAVLVIVLAGFVACTAFIPQGREALEIAEAADATTLHKLAAWGLTSVFESAWVRALGVLLAANLGAIALAAAFGKGAGELTTPPASAPLSAKLTAAVPERAVETLRENFRARFGAPTSEEVKGSRVTMMFETSPNGRLAPMLSHLGLVTLVVGAGLLAAPIPENRTAPRALLEVKDRATGFLGTFDLVAGESVQFFRYPARYTVRGYVASKDGLGPAVRLERREDKRAEEFWVFVDAPAGFDERHRGGEVAVRALKATLTPLPGAGLAASPASVLLLFGLGLIVAGLAGGRRPEGRIWVEADGDDVRIVGLPREKEDKSFYTRFDRWVALATAVLAEP